MKPQTKAKVTACLLTMMAPTIATHANEGIQLTDWSMMRDTKRLTVEKPKVTNVSGLGKRIVCEARESNGTATYQADGLTELLRQLGYSRDEMWGKQDRLAFAWYRINNAKFKRGEPVEFEGRVFIKNSI